MKTSIIGLAIAMSLMMVPAFAYTDIQTSLNAAGYTRVNELAVAMGPYHGAPTETAYIHNGLENNGWVYAVSEIKSTGDWKLQESKVVQGAGETLIAKDVTWWTVSPVRKWDGTLKYPTETSIFNGFYTADTTVEKEVFNVANDAPAGVDNANRFLQEIDTNDNFMYVESVGINLPTDCTPRAPDMDFRMPSCKNCE
jgi:hypothetical protein